MAASAGTTAETARTARTARTAKTAKTAKTVRVGIVGVSGYGGRELLRLCATHPAFDVVYAGGESSVDRKLAGLFPALADHPWGALVVQRFVPEALSGVDLLFTSLPTGASREPLARVPRDVKVVDVGGDHRFVEGWTYGVTELPGARAAIACSSRVANPGCYAVTSLLALAPLVAGGLIEPEGIVVDAKSGVSGAGRGGSSAYGFSEVNEDVMPYGLVTHDHVREMQEALSRLAGDGRRATLAFTAHLIPMTRGIISTCYGRPRGRVTTEQALDVARAFYHDAPFVKVRDVDTSASRTGAGVHSKWATGTNLAFLTYAVNAPTGYVVGIGATDNLGKGAAGQAMQNANLMTGQPETAGLAGQPLWP